MLRAAEADDAVAVAQIYNWYVENTVITFEETAVPAAAMAERIISGDPTRPWIVLEEAGEIVGYACAERWKSRCAYRNSRETSVYLDRDRRGQGFGAVLYRELLTRLRKAGMHTLIAGIALPNESSIALHEKLGFEKIGQFREVGNKFGRQIDVGYWQLLL